jgi:hypothetical protein
MFSRIELENYRGFERYRLRGLARVNLLVGKNNCGKTSLLEAVHLLASGGSPEVLAEIARLRGEIVLASETPWPSARRLPADLSHFFHGHQFGPDAHFCVSTDQALGRLTVRVVELADAEGPLLFQDPEEVPPVLAIRIEIDSGSGARPFPDMPVTDEGALSLDTLRRLLPPFRRDREQGASVQFISPDSLEPRSMSAMWDRVIKDARESEVIRALNILEPRITNIFFLSGDTTYRAGGPAGALVAFEGTRRRDPLGSYGEGMRRLLALSLSLIQADGGVLLVDEIDTGLHYSIMGDMWRLVVEGAKQANVQVFATTHSLDCVRGLAWLCDSYPSLRGEVSIQKIERELEESVALDADRIMLAVDQEMEVR